MNSIATNRQFLEGEELISRFRNAGDVTLDLLHRDGRIGDQWIRLQPQEFELLWRLAKQPAERVTRRQLLQDVWRIEYEPQTNSVAVHVARIRSKLSSFGLAGILATHCEGGYFLNVPKSPDQFMLRRCD